MGLYSDAILKQMRQIGEPIRATSRTTGAPMTTTARTTVKPPGPAIDIMQLLMMLMFSGAFQQKGGTTGTIGDIAGEPMSAMQYGLQGGAAPGSGGLASLMKLLTSIPGMGGIPGI